MKVVCVQCDVVFDDPAANSAAAVARIQDTEADLIVFGHSHRAVIKRIGRTLAVNPGSAGRPRFRDPVTAAIAQIAPDGEVTAELIALV